MALVDSQWTECMERLPHSLWQRALMKGCLLASRVCTWCSHHWKKILSHRKALRAHSKVTSAALVLTALWVCGGCAVLHLMVYNKGNSRLGFLRELFEKHITKSHPRFTRSFSDFLWFCIFNKLPKHWGVKSAIQEIVGSGRILQALWGPPDKFNPCSFEEAVLTGKIMSM